MLVVAFSGKIGSGKSSVSAGVATALGWQRVGFGEYVRGVAKARGLDDSRLTLQNLGEELLTTDARAFCADVLAQAPTPLASLVVDGVRHEQVIHLLQELVSPRTLVHVHLDLDDATRVDRVYSRQGETEAQELKTIDAHPTEQQVINSLPQRADIVFNSADNLESVVQQVIVWIKSRII